MDQNKVGQFITLCRKEKQMTQGDLSKALNVSVQAVSKWELGKNYPDISLFPKLAEILGTSVGELLKGERSSLEIKTEETVSELIDYTKTLESKKRKRRYILTLVILAFTNSALHSWTSVNSDLQQYPYKMIEVNSENSQLYTGVESTFPSFISLYTACTTEMTKTDLFETHKRTLFGAHEKATSLVLTFGSTDTSKVSENTATLWCPLTMEFVTELTFLANDSPMVLFDYDENIILEETLHIFETDQNSHSTEVFLRIYDDFSLADTSKMGLIVQFTMRMSGYVIKGEFPSNWITSPQLLNFTQKIIPQDYLDTAKANIEQLTKALLKAQSLSNQLDANKANFYAGYLEYVADYPFSEERRSVFEDNQWRIKQSMVSKDTIVTFTTDLEGTPISIEIDKGDQSTSMGGIAGTLQTVVMNKLTNWPFPEGYLEQIFYNLTENNNPWIIEMKEADVTVICTDYLNHYLIKWPQ